MITLTKNINEANCVTHAGNFHADDVFSTVFLEKLFDNINLIRLNDYQDDGTKITYDIGLGRFDHHGANFDKTRPNGIHYCSFGLLWQEYGLKYLEKIRVNNPKDVFRIFDYLLVNQIDAFDNGELIVKSEYNLYLIADLIELFRPSFDEEIDTDNCFLEAVNYAKIIFDIILKDAIAKSKAEEILKEKMSSIKDKILILDKFIPYEFAIFDLKLDVDFVIYPSNRGGYAAHTVPTYYKGFISKVPFKQEWAGLRDNELQNITGVKTARFCHNKCFLATTDTLDDALKLVNLTIKS